MRGIVRWRYLFWISVAIWALRLPAALDGRLELDHAAQIAVVVNAVLINIAWASGRNPWRLLTRRSE